MTNDHLCMFALLKMFQILSKHRGGGAGRCLMIGAQTLPPLTFFFSNFLISISKRNERIIHL